MPIQSTPASGSKGCCHAEKCCLRTVAIATIFAGAVTLVIGVLAYLACKGTMPSGLNTSVGGFQRIGPVNSILMIAGGATLMVMGFLGWITHWMRETNPNARLICCLKKKEPEAQLAGMSD